MNQPEERSSGVFPAEPLQGHRCGHTAGREASCGQVGGAQRWGVGGAGGRGCQGLGVPGGLGRGGGATWEHLLLEVSETGSPPGAEAAA